MLTKWLATLQFVSESKAVDDILHIDAAIAASKSDGMNGLGTTKERRRRRTSFNELI
jgi:hypothetical protein